MPLHFIFIVFGNKQLLIGEFYLNLQRRDEVIREKLDQTADTWIEVGFFAKNIMKFLRGLLCLIFEKSGLKTFQKRIMSFFDSMEAVLPTPQGCMKEIN
ncbi:hypothetical protein CJ232_02965 [Hoylesella timonensis]|uniref:Uncharacterized protein n=1 Tax=Hoylesella timonensis TaxID=386414 RepID=A0A2N6Q7G7_9BACT|nr:hypothetical protein CJ232_02965 [Hoylesella timonensis]